MRNITINADLYDESQLNVQMIRRLINEHYSKERRRIIKNINYYLGKQEILKREKKFKDSANNRVVCNHAKDIADTSAGYFMNAPIAYSLYDIDGDEAALDKLKMAFDMANVDDVDSENAKDMAVAGVAYEYLYIKPDETVVSIKNVEPNHTFLVYDDTIEEKLLFGVYYYRFKDALTGSYCYRATVGTEHYIYTMLLQCNDSSKHPDITNEPQVNLLQGVPFVEYKNNKEKQGDFEQQISLIDAYNTLTSDRVNDKEQFVNALLVIYGASLGDDNEEVSATLKTLKEQGLLELPDGASASYITSALDENGVEVLRLALKEDIYNFSHVPNLSDENFAGNTSGVAMEYKLLGLQMITATKEKYYRKGLKRRMQLMANYLSLKNIAVNPNEVQITFTRSLPKNVTELAQMITNLKGTVSQETLIAQLPFVEDPSLEIERVKEENAEAIKQQQEMFASGYNMPIGNEGAASEFTAGSDEDEEQSKDEEKKPESKENGANNAKKEDK